MAFCEKCGVQLEEGAKFCPACGATVEEPQVYEEQTYEAPVTPEAPAYTGEFDPADIEQNRIMAVLGYLLFLIPLLAAKESPFARFHANQGLLVLILSLAVAVLTPILAVIPIIGWIVAMVLPLAVFVLAVIGAIGAYKGEAKELPLIGKFRIIK